MLTYRWTLAETERFINRLISHGWNLSLISASFAHSDYAGDRRVWIARKDAEGIGYLEVAFINGITEVQRFA